MAVSDWSTTASDNDSTPPNGAPEGMAPSAVNDTIRQIMADVKAFYDVAVRTDQTSYTLNAPVSTDNTTADEIGFKGLPQNSQGASNYTCVLSDAGKSIVGTGNTVTIPANASVAYPLGTVLTFVNGAGAGEMTISITSDELRLMPTTSTGSRTLAESGIATAYKVTSTLWFISGVGLS